MLQPSAFVTRLQIKGYGFRFRAHVGLRVKQRWNQGFRVYRLVGGMDLSDRSNGEDHGKTAIIYIQERLFWGTA